MQLAFQQSVYTGGHAQGAVLSRADAFKQQRIELQKVLTMVYDIVNHLLLGLCASSLL
jgi:hypothetical protein